MDIKRIKSIIDLAKEEGLSCLEYEADNIKISVSLPTAGSSLNINPVAYGQELQQFSELKKQNSVDNSFHEVTSPFVGTFYTQSAPDEPIFANNGDRVKKGQTLCIVEAMKIMNEIDSDVDGEIVEVCVENESLVEFGQVLYKIRI